MGAIQGSPTLTHMVSKIPTHLRRRAISNWHHTTNLQASQLQKLGLHAWGGWDTTHHRANCSTKHCIMMLLLISSASLSMSLVTSHCNSKWCHVCSFVWIVCLLSTHSPLILMDLYQYKIKSIFYIISGDLWTTKDYLDALI